MDVVLVIGRILFALMFVNGGLAHLKNVEAMSGYAAFKKVPMAKQSVLASGLLLALGGLSVIFGVYADLGALVLAVLLIAMAVMMHDFWRADAQSKQMEMISFFKNISMAGAGLVMFAAIASSDAGVEVIGPMLTDGLFQG